METKELKEILTAWDDRSTLSDRQFNMVIEVMKEIVKRTHNNAIRLASESMENCSLLCSNSFTILKLLKP